ncbi:lytic transglycosylase domain-containing protein [Parvularcula sp. IMCC14364]|uniref:lytic transglycosylase domain-containing protein n=1 Tax=Parvularcula sp. IMCC14364 TaxID=3067902 RepID=UPI002741FC7E|nr:lytic transglycosylase domain-containing protein [Parvularcula sp. IMCC14364]
MSLIRKCITAAATLIILGFCTSALAAPVPRIKPAAPEPVYLSPADYAMLASYFEALDARQWSRARGQQSQLSDTVAQSIAQWAWFRKDPPDLDFMSAGRFIDAHKDWPSISYIQQLAEKSIPEDARPDSVIAFFSNRTPRTGTGHLRLAQALLAKGETERATSHFRNAWIDHDWGSTNEREIARYYGDYLRPEDHARKADRQLFEIVATNTRRLLPYLSPSEKRKAEARIALLRADGNAVSLFNRLTPEEKTDSGVLHAVTRYYRRKGEELTAISYARQAPFAEKEIRNRARWWTEKRLLARWALKNGFYEDAYAMTAYTGLIEGANFAAAEFEAGWIALRFLNDPERARPHFAYLNAGVTAPISLARAQYWLGRTFEAAGDTTRANLHYQVAAKYPLTYYGQLAWEKVQGSIAPPGFPPVTTLTEDAKVVFDARPVVYAMRVLAELDRDREFIIFARQLDDQLQTPEEYAAYEEFMTEQGMVFLSVRAGKVAVRRNADAPSVSYPLIAVPDEAKAFAEHALILGLSRQESEFNPQAFSSAKARGIMQLLASTAQITARKEGLPYYRSRLLDDPSYNMIIGSAHLKHLQARFDGSYIMTLAGYNAGPHRVDQWVETYGDPRQPDVDPVDWVELIPFGETRNYVQRVMENVQIYRARINSQPITGQLSRDLVRGGGTTTAIGITPPTSAITPAANTMSASQASRGSMPQPVAFLIAADMTADDMLRQPAADTSSPDTRLLTDRLMIDQLMSGPSATSSQLYDGAAEDGDSASQNSLDDCDLGEQSVYLEADDLNNRELSDTPC